MSMTPPLPYRYPTVPPRCPHACGWLAAGEVLNIEKSVGAGLPQIKIGGPNGAFAYSIAPRTVKNQGGPPGTLAAGARILLLPADGGELRDVGGKPAAVEAVQLTPQRLVRREENHSDRK